MCSRGTPSNKEDSDNEVEDVATNLEPEKVADDVAEVKKEMDVYFLRTFNPLKLDVFFAFFPNKALSLLRVNVEGEEETVADVRSNQMKVSFDHIS